MFAVTSAEMQRIEETAFAQGISAENLIETVGKGIASELIAHSTRREITAYIGKGHNAADALVAVRILAIEGWKVQLRLAYPAEQLRPLTRKAYESALQSGAIVLSEAPTKVKGLMLDGLLGLGAKGEPRAEITTLCKEINTISTSCENFCIAIDIPTGLDADTGTPSPSTIRADHTLSIAVLKRGLLEHSAANYVGTILRIPIEELPPPAHSDIALIENSLHHHKRPFDFHKGQAGSVGIWAGSTGMLGAACLCAEAALRAGAGLVTLYTNQEHYPILATKAPAPIMVKPLSHQREILETKHNAYVIGPGLGADIEPFTLWDMLEAITVPIVLDADALNCIAKHAKQYLLNSHHILTPHPGEMRRLLKDAESMTRSDIVQQFCSNHPSVLLYKGARTIVSKKNQPLWINAIGGPGMATAGQGDVLAGVIGGLCAQGLDPLESAKQAAYHCGRASKIATKSAFSLTALDTLAALSSTLP